MRFQRKQKPGRYRDYHDYKPYLREDFLQRCAYCLITEARWGSERNFVVEHFRPKKRFPTLVCTYTNLYYACNRCNEHKGSKWPVDEMSKRGFRFLDPCQVDMYERHLEERLDGRLVPRTKAGEYTSAHLALNRELLVEWRVQRRMLLQDIEQSREAAELISREVMRTVAEDTRVKLGRLNVTGRFAIGCSPGTKFVLPHGCSLRCAALAIGREATSPG